MIVSTSTQRFDAIVSVRLKGGIPVTREAQIDFLLDLNKEHSKAFVASHRARIMYRAQHPTEIAICKCMDGRIHVPVVTKIPPGILQPFRNLGGKFNLGWPFFAKELYSWVQYASLRGRPSLMLITYHFSRGDVHRGCAGFGYNTDEAVAHTAALKAQVEHVFSRSSGAVYPVQCGFETDLDALVLHGESGEVVDLSTVTDATEDELASLIERLYPHMPRQIQHDFLPLVRGNIEHIADVRASNREIAEVEHKEWVLAVGRGFDWLHVPNLALIVGPWNPNLSVPVRTAAGIIKSNIDAGRIANESFVLLTAAIFREPASEEPLLAREKALFLKDFAIEKIRAAHPALVELMTPLPVIVDMNTRKMTVVE